MTTTISTKVKFIVVLALILSMLPIIQAAEGDPDLDEATGGMSSDATILLSELLFWIVAASLIVCVVLGGIGILSADPDLTKKGIKGFAVIIALVLLYYMSSFIVKYLQTRYG